MVDAGGQLLMDSCLEACADRNGSCRYACKQEDHYENCLQFCDQNLELCKRQC